MKFLKKMICLVLAIACAFSSLSAYKVNAAGNDVVVKEVDSKVIDVTDINTTIGNDIYMTNKQIISLECRANGDVNPNHMDLKDLYLKVIPDDKRIHFDFSAYKLRDELRNAPQEIRIILSCSYNYAPLDTTITIKLMNNNVTLYRKLNLHVRNPLCEIKRDDVNMYSDETVGLNLQGMYASTYFNGTYDEAVDLTKATVESSNPDVVAINNGILIAQNEGTATVNVTYNESYKGYVLNKVNGFYEYDGLKYLNSPTLQTSFNVTVKNKIKGVSFTETKVNVKVGETYQQQPILEVNKDGATTSYEWESSNTRVATVNENGVVTVKNEGDAIITVRTTDKSKSVATYTVKGYDTTEVVDNPNAEIVKPGDNINSSKPSTIVGPDGTKYIKAQAPDGVKAIAGKNSIKVTWNAVNGASAYVVYRASENSDYKQIGITAVNNFTDKGAVYNKKYIYKIVTTPLTGTIGNSDMSEESNLVNFKIKTPKIKSVKKNKSKYTIKISGTTYAGYLIYVGKNKKPKKVTAAVNKKTVDLFLKKNKTYYIRIKAYAKVNNSNMYSKFSKVKKIKTR